MSRGAEIVVRETVALAAAGPFAGVARRAFGVAASWITGGLASAAVGLGVEELISRTFAGSPAKEAAARERLRKASEDERTMTGAFAVGGGGKPAFSPGAVTGSQREILSSVLALPDQEFEAALAGAKETETEIDDAIIKAFDIFSNLAVVEPSGGVSRLAPRDAILVVSALQLIMESARRGRLEGALAHSATHRDAVTSLEGSRAFRQYR